MPNYLSYQRINGVPVACDGKDGRPAPATEVNADTKFQQNGTILAIAYPGYNVMVFGAEVPGGLLVFQRTPVYVPGYDQPAGDFGRVVPQPDGTVVIEWPL